MKLLDGGTDSGRMNLVCLAEGYLEGDPWLFDRHARQLAEQLEREPWYRRGILNLHAIFVPSKERAPTVADGKPRDTAFKAYYGGDRAAHVISGDDRKAHEASRGIIPSGEGRILHVLVLVNSTLYGGRGGGKGGGLCWTYTDTRNPGRWTSCALHELGHSLFGLADEYGTSDGPPLDRTSRTKEPSEPNITLDPLGAKWRHLLTGAVEGADGKNRGIYRPTRNCRMRSFTAAFCPVCADAARRVLDGYLEAPIVESDDQKGDQFTVIPPGGLEAADFDYNLGGVMAAEKWLLKRLFG